MEAVFKRGFLFRQKSRCCIEIWSCMDSKSVDYHIQILQHVKEVEPVTVNCFKSSKGMYIIVTNVSEQILLRVRCVKYEI